MDYPFKAGILAGLIGVIWGSSTGCSSRLADTQAYFTHLKSLVEQNAPNTKIYTPEVISRAVGARPNCGQSDLDRKLTEDRFAAPVDFGNGLEKGHVETCIWMIQNQPVAAVQYTHGSSSGYVSLERVFLY